ncbi:MAG: hypothetical protein NTY39_10495 [Campylobacterales bacterium]|nr:hypothetical protein [Campylobacterales bacterium]
MVKAFCLAWVLLVSLEAAPAWRETKNFILKKDEVAKIVIKTISPKLERVFFWRWTLYTDKKLVVHEKFDRVVGQHILDLDIHQAFRKRLLGAVKSEQDVPYGLVVFKKFDDVNKTAQFDFFLIDRENRVEVDYVSKEPKK